MRWSLQWWLPAIVILFAREATSHGRLIEPPSRATMWRYGFDTPPNYNDHELYCGGFSRQWNKNGGKCGICGDPWDSPTPRAHEAGGKYGLGVIVRKYKPGASIPIRVELTANHHGYFEFRLCPHNNPRRVATQECLDKYLLEQARGGGARFYPGDGGNRVFELRYKLPSGLTCSQCVLQWRYIAGNNWGNCPNGTGAVGCGPQEEFRACADVSIDSGEGTVETETTETLETSGTTVPATGVTTPTPETVAMERWLVVSIVLATLVAVCAIIALLYLYFYHARDTVKQWLARKKPVPPPRTRKNLHQQQQEERLQQEP